MIPPLYHWRLDDYRDMVEGLVAQDPIQTDTWQGMDVRNSKAHYMHELEDVTFLISNVSGDADAYPPLSTMIKADLPWAEDHFQERVGGVPLNPPPSSMYWPYAVRGNGDHLGGGVFDHTYPERFWPRFANEGHTRPNGRQVFVPHNGIRFEYGDLSDVVALLVHDRGTRQAYLPVWFPEDTGATDAKGSPIRVPCTLGYHFMIRKNKLSCRYYIRSCDVFRHLNNDMYFAVRLMEWMADTVNHYTALEYDNDPGHLCPPMPADITPGRLMVHVASLHLFVADKVKLKERMNS